MNQLTESQCQLINFCWEFFVENDQLPSFQKIADTFGWRSPNAACEKLISLKNHLLLEKNTVGKWKFTNLAKKELLRGPYIAVCPGRVRNRFKNLEAA